MRSKKRTWKLIGIIMLVFFLVIQFIRPTINTAGTTSGPTGLPDSIEEILVRACYDCHSNEAKLKWFDQLAPAYWLVSNHILEGRAVLNFSNWKEMAPADRKGKLFESLNQMVFKTMPLSDYLLLHQEAKVSEKDLAVLKNYLSTLAISGISDSSLVLIANNQFRDWIKKLNWETGVLPEPNGFAFSTGYRNWQVISASDRFDNGTMRVILGNDIAIRAIENARTNPWPDGTGFAKLAWDQLWNEQGIVRTGAFKQVEFMIKDEKKYASTDGWGWGRWKGLSLIPYGKEALFTTECMNCHQPMKFNDFVFTIPIHRDSATVFRDIQNWKLMGSVINKKEGGLSVLYANEPAVFFVRDHHDNAYPESSALALVSWQWREDPHWFGANIPGEISNIELVRFQKNRKGIVGPVYEKYGAGGKSIAISPDTLASLARVKWILSQRAAVLP